jgi:hypothetical protein
MHYTSHSRELWAIIFYDADVWREVKLKTLNQISLVYMKVKQIFKYNLVH